MDTQPKIPTYKYDCSPEALLNNYGEFKPEFNADIAGIGVIIGFVGTSGLAMVLLVINYLFAHAPAESPLESQHQEWKPNLIDLHFLYVFRGLFRIEGKWRRASAVADEIILDMCDIQLVTGLAILTSAFISLNNKSSPLSALDWEMAVSLVWFAAATHMSGLVSLRSYLGERQKHKAFRVMSMSLLLVILLVAMGPTGYFNWAASSSGSPKEFTAALPQSPAFCYFHIGHARALWNSGCYMDPYFSGYSCHRGSWDREIGTNIIETIAMQGMIMGMTILTYGFAIRLIKLFPQLSKPITTYIRRPLSYIAEAILRKLDDIEKRMNNRQGHIKRLSYHFWVGFVVMPSVGLYISYRSTIHVFNSLLVEIFWLALVFSWGLLKLYYLRNLNLSMDPDAGDPTYNAWSFGQVIAVALLASPLVAVLRRLLSSPQNGASPSDTQPSQSPPLNIDQSQELELRPHGSRAQQHSTEPASEALVAENGSKRSNRSLVYLTTISTETECESSAWFRVCIINACMLWTGVASVATMIVLINGKLWGNSAAGSTIFSMGLVELWFSWGGFTWFLLFFYPMILALLVSTGLRLRGSNGCLSRRARYWYTLLCFFINITLLAICFMSHHIISYATAVASVAFIYGLVIVYS